MVVHLNEDALSELMDGGGSGAAEEHLATCERCRDELDALRDVRTALRNLPELSPPAELWARIEAGLAEPVRVGRRRMRWPSLIALQAAALAAVFVVGLGLGRMFEGPGVPSLNEPTATAAAEEAPAGSLAEALEEVRRRGAEYDAALRDLERLARAEGAPVGSLAEQRLVSLNLLVEASRTALTVDPADPVLNAYLFAALEERDRVMQQMGATPEEGSGVLWR